MYTYITLYLTLTCFNLNLTCVTTSNSTCPKKDNQPGIIISLIYYYHTLLPTIYY